MPVVLYGCETYSLTLSEERRLRVFENRLLGRVFGPKHISVAFTPQWLYYLERRLNPQRWECNAYGSGGWRYKDDLVSSLTRCIPHTRTITSNQHDHIASLQTL